MWTTARDGSRSSPIGWRDSKAGRSPFEKSRRIEMQYAATLRRVAAVVGQIVDGFGDPIADPEAAAAITVALNRYSELLGPWARRVASRMIAETDAQDVSAWAKTSREMSRALRHEIEFAPTGELLRSRLADQVRLIKSLPTEAAARVHRLTLAGITEGTRASVIAAEIARSGEVTKSRATLIARTEVSRTASELVQARALHVGSTAYVWETSRDADVRPSHRKMQGQVVEWGSPPTLDGLVGHAGCLPNCRCWPRPLIPSMGHNRGPA